MEFFLEAGDVGGGSTTQRIDEVCIASIYWNNDWKNFFVHTEIPLMVIKYWMGWKLNNIVVMQNSLCPLQKKVKWNIKIESEQISGLGILSSVVGDRKEIVRKDVVSSENSPWYNPYLQRGSMELKSWITLLNQDAKFPRQWRFSTNALAPMLQLPAILQSVVFTLVLEYYCGNTDVSTPMLKRFSFRTGIVLPML